MPSSRCNHIPVVINVINQLAPTSILDIGTGFGKWGMLFREYTDILASEQNPKRYAKENWAVKIDGIEGFPDYITPIHQYVYNEIFLGDMREEIKRIGTYDVIFLGDVIEHLHMSEGIEFLKECLVHTKKAVIVSTPSEETRQQDLCNNELEKHQCLWQIDNFRRLGPCVAKVLKNHILVAVLLKPGVKPPRLVPPLIKKKLRRRVEHLARPLLRPLKKIFLGTRHIGLREG